MISFEDAEKLAHKYVGKKICPLNQCELTSGEDDENFYYFHFYQTITGNNWTIKVSKDGTSVEEHKE